MAEFVITPLETIDNTFTEYELPPEGISVLGYIVRRLHKTKLLSEVEGFTQRQLYAHALAQIAHYAAASSATFGQFPYEPHHDKVGACHMERDPQTSAIVMATLENVTPTNRFSYLTKLPNGDLFNGCKVEAESKFKLRGWETPTATTISFTSADESYRAELQGTINHERLPRLVGSPLIRAYGELDISDNHGHHGRLTLHRNATATINIHNANNHPSLTREITIS